MAKNERDLFDDLVQLGFQSDLARRLAAEQLRRGIPHVEHASFLAIIRSFMTSPDDEKKIETALAPTPEMRKHNTLIRLRSELLEAGVQGDALLRFERAVQKALLNEIFCFLSGHYSNSSIPVDTFHVCSVDETTEEVTAHLTGLDESLAALDS